MLQDTTENEITKAIHKEGMVLLQADVLKNNNNT